MKVGIRKKNRKILLAALGIVLSCVLFFGLISLWEARYGTAETVTSSNSNSPDTTENEDAVFYNGQWYVPRQNVESVLVMGVDKYETETTADSYNNSQQADFLTLLIVDQKNNSYTTLQINRDTMANIPILGVRGEEAGSFTGQLALTHTYGSGGSDSCRNTVKAVSDFLFGVKIDHYISLTMDAIPKINDMVGGVSLTLLDDFTMYNPAMQKGKEVHLTGDMALAYVRYRKDLEDTTNVNRMKRQRQYLSALKGRISENAKSNDSFVLETLDAVSKYMVSDCTVNQLSDLFEKCLAGQDNGITEIAGKSIKGKEYMEFHADEDSLKKTVISLFYEPSATSEGAK